MNSGRVVFVPNWLRIDFNRPVPQLPRQSDPHAFLVLPENEFAVAAVKKLAPGVKRRRIWLVTLIGPAGCGKSRLARELIQGWEAERPDARTVYITASQFAAQLAEAAASKTIAQFQSRFRHDTQLLICEDIQILGPRQESQAQLLATMDDVTSSGGVVLLTSTRMPASIPGLNRRLVNRMHGGVCAEIELPGPASQRKLIEEFLSGESLPLSHVQIEGMISTASVSPRELLGLIHQLQAETVLRTGKRQPVRVNVEAVLADRQRSPLVSVAEIARVTAERFGVNVADMKGPHRGQSLSQARQTAMYLARELAAMHYAQIGAYFHRGNHSTVIHACQKIARDLETKPALQRHIQAIRDELLTRP